MCILVVQATNESMSHIIQYSAWHSSSIPASHPAVPGSIHDAVNDVNQTERRNSLLLEPAALSAQCQVMTLKRYVEIFQIINPKW